ncbi:eukaryotic translation initiation factor 3 [Piptocephalis cylindrospora]|uniref:Eukaryotic translation initiation factor 3 subunit B n=1 Tax=Piptocephalis cylindrospora TaxID=1907219 RepID=A0A4P9Y6W6_9FUNG|nr:eukaryotic translation initiation factor 3 [Piptocephalis cylindrospora]|eukprot:RKP14444.1 eukaryotic translation initiation factor 3 [Piptocephalis cylindrospora]
MPTVAHPDFSIDKLPATEADVDVEDIRSAYALPESTVDDFSNIVIVDNVPVVDSAKEDKLTGVLRKIFKPCGKLAGTADVAITMPKDADTGKTQGFAFIEFASPEGAVLAVKNLDNYRMDKSHVLRVNLFDDVEKYVDQADQEYEEPVIEPYKEKEHLKSWLADPSARDQWVTLRDEEVSIFWNGKSEAPEHVYSRNYWTETYIQWSPLGSYLTTYHRQGVALWGGAGWNKIIRFFHPGVKLSHFSHSEKYFMTWSNEPAVAMANSPFGPEDEGNQLMVWDTVTGTLLRSFPTPDGKVVWPTFKWSPDDRYFARVAPGKGLSVYEAPGMGLVDKKSIPIDGIVDFEWAPTGTPPDLSRSSDKPSTTTLMVGGKRMQDEALLSYWTPEVGNQPARVTIMNIPSRQIIRTKNLFQVSDCKLHWHPQGDFLCVKVDRHTRTRKSTFTNLEIFRIRDKDIPVEVIELKEQIVIAFAWEPKGERFIAISQPEVTPAMAAAVAPGQQITPKTTVGFYGPDRRKGKGVAGLEGSFSCMKTLQKRTANAIFFSPNGRFVVLATLRSQTNWDLEFFDMDFEPIVVVDEAAADPGAWINLVATQEHYAITDLSWDPTGRYVASFSSAWRHSMENGFAIWDFKGAPLYKKAVERFKQLLWRPRPPSLLSKEQQKKIRKGLKEYSKEFDAIDASTQSASSAAVIAHRQRLLKEWNAWRERVETDLAEERSAAGPEGTLPFSEEPDEVIEEMVEDIVEETEEVVKA